MQHRPGSTIVQQKGRTLHAYSGKAVRSLLTDSAEKKRFGRRVMRPSGRYFLLPGLDFHQKSYFCLNIDRSTISSLTRSPAKTQAILEKQTA